MLQRSSATGKTAEENARCVSTSNIEFVRAVNRLGRFRRLRFWWDMRRERGRIVDL